jgi:hypothetical protein
MVKEAKTSFRIQEEIWKRFEKHIFLLRYGGKEKDRQDWLVEAIEEKLAKQEYSDMKDRLSEIEKKMTLSLDEKLHKKLNKQTELGRRAQGSYSKKQLIAEA